MAKKNFENKSEQLLSKFTSAPLQEETSGSESDKNMVRSAKSEKRGASFSLSVDVLETLRERSFTERISKSDIVENALINYFNK